MPGASPYFGAHKQPVLRARTGKIPPTLPNEPTPSSSPRLIPGGVQAPRVKSEVLSQTTNSS